ncbi:MAG: DUF4258 domain-containing protein [Bacteroidota bacterium]
MGIIILVFILKKKSEDNPISFCYLPNCRVLKDMRSKQIVFGENLDSKYRDTVLIKALLVDGKIDFGKSDTKTQPCKTYHLFGKTDEQNHWFVVKNCDSTVIFTNKR